MKIRRGAMLLLLNLLDGFVRVVIPIGPWHRVELGRWTMVEADQVTPDQCLKLWRLGNGRALAYRRDEDGYSGFLGKHWTLEIR